MQTNKINILCLTWNTQSVKLCDEEPGKTSSFSLWSRIKKEISEHKPSIVAIGFQEDIKPGSYAHCTFFPKAFAEVGYTLFEQSEMVGLGKTCFDGLKHGSLFLRGLRLSVYVREEMISRVAKVHMPQEFNDSFFRNKGAIAIYCTIKGTGDTVAIINTHFPFEAHSLSEMISNHDKLVRQDALNNQNSFFNKVYRNLVANKDAYVSHAIVMGDFNYRMDPFVEWSATKTGYAILESKNQFLSDYDELWQQMSKGNIYIMNEGIDNLGPQFFPTCKMNKHRDTNQVSINSYNVGKDDSRVPSYCDRIIYSPSGIECTIYDAIDEETTSMSDHAAVYGIFLI